MVTYSWKLKSAMPYSGAISGLQRPGQCAFYKPSLFRGKRSLPSARRGISSASRHVCRGHNHTFHVEVTPVNDSEDPEALFKRFKYEVGTANIIMEARKRRFHENPQDIKKRKEQEKGMWKYRDIKDFNTLTMADTLGGEANQHVFGDLFPPYVPDKEDPVASTRKDFGNPVASRGKALGSPESRIAAKFNQIERLNEIEKEWVAEKRGEGRKLNSRFWESRQIDSDADAMKQKVSAGDSLQKPKKGIPFLTSKQKRSQEKAKSHLRSTKPEISHLKQPSLSVKRTEQKSPEFRNHSHDPKADWSFPSNADRAINGASSGTRRQGGQSPSNSVETSVRGNEALYHTRNGSSNGISERNTKFSQFSQPGQKASQNPSSAKTRPKPKKKVEFQDLDWDQPQSNLKDFDINRAKSAGFEPVFDLHQDKFQGDGSQKASEDMNMGFTSERTQDSDDDLDWSTKKTANSSKGSSSSIPNQFSPENQNLQGRTEDQRALGKDSHKVDFRNRLGTIMRIAEIGETVSTEDRKYCISVIPLLQNEIDKLASRPREGMSRAQINCLRAKISKAKKSIQAIERLFEDPVSTPVRPPSEHKPKSDSQSLIDLHSSDSQGESSVRQPEAIPQDKGLEAPEDLSFYIAVHEIINKEPHLITQEDRNTLAALAPLIEKEYVRWQGKPRDGLTRNQIGNIRGKTARTRGYLQKIAEILGTDSLKTLTPQDEASESGSQESLQAESKLQGMMLTDASISRAREQFQASFLKDQRVQEGSVSR